MNLMLLIVLAIFSFYIYMGSKHGFVKTVFYFVSSIVLLIVSFAVSPIISHKAMNNPAVVRFVEDKIDKAYDVYKEHEAKKEKQDGEKSEGKEKKEGKEGKDKKVKIELENKKKTQKSLKSRGFFAEDVSKKLGKMYLTPLIIRTTAFLFVYVIAGLILLIMEKTLCLVAKLPVLKSINRLGGAGIGALRGLITVWLLFMVMTILSDKELAAAGIRQIGENEVLRLLYDNNMIVKIISSFIS